MPQQYTNFVTVGGSIIIPVVKGDFTKCEWIDKFGENPDIGTSTIPTNPSTYEDITDHGGIYVESSPATTLYASSSHAGDTVVIVVEAWSAMDNAVKQINTVTLAGQSQVEIGTSVDSVSIRRAYNDGAVDLQGDVYIAEADTLTAGVPDTAAKIRGKILLGNQQTEMLIDKIPVGYSGYSLYGDSSVVAGTNADVIVRLFIRRPGGVFRSSGDIGLLAAGSSSFGKSKPVAKYIPEGSTFKATAVLSTANNTRVSAEMTVLLVPNL